MGLHLHSQIKGYQVVFLCTVRQLIVTASVVPSSPILVTLMKEALSSSKTSVLTTSTWRNIPADTILHSHCRENLKSYKFMLVNRLWRPTELRQVETPTFSGQSAHIWQWSCQCPSHYRRFLALISVQTSNISILYLSAWMMGPSWARYVADWWKC
jgi:hypothetical protein